MASPSISDLLERAKAAPPEHRDLMVVLDRAVADQVDALQQRIDQLDAQRAEAVDDFQAQREEVAADQRFTDPRPAEIDAAEKKTIEKLTRQIEKLEAERDALTEGATLTLRFTRLPGQAWAEITSRLQARPGIGVDRIAGYDYHEAAKQAAAYVDEAGDRYGHRVTVGDDGQEVLEDLLPEQWQDLLVLLTGGEFERVAMLLFDMNDWGPRQRSVAAKKA